MSTVARTIPSSLQLTHLTSLPLAKIKMLPAKCTSDKGVNDVASERGDVSLRRERKGEGEERRGVPGLSMNTRTWYEPWNCIFRMPDRFTNHLILVSSADL